MLRPPHHRWLVRRFASYALPCVLFASSSAAASGVSPVEATAEQKQQATERFIAGKQAFESGDFERALVELGASLDVVDSPNAHLELARALRDLGRLFEAWAEFGVAASTATHLAPVEERYAKTAEAAVSERGEVESKIAFVTVTVAHSPADASLSVGGHRVARTGWGAPVAVAPGSVDIVLTGFDGAVIARATITAAAAQGTAVSLDVGPAPAPAPAAADATTSSTLDTADDDKPIAAGVDTSNPVDTGRPQSDRLGLRPWAYVTGALGAAGLATFAVFGLMSSSTYSDLKSTCPHGCPPDKRGEIDRGGSEQTVANVALGIGTAGIAAGATLLLLSLHQSAPHSGAVLVVAPGYLGVRGAM